MLVACPECKKEISEDAGSCPQCGYRKGNTAMVVFGVLLAVLLGYFLVSILF
jgi:RNA polymerase subunit RPABC4/transcription elongation factor Spt4